MSDIVGDPMSPIDPIDDMFDLADAEIRAVQVTEILADLIAELRDRHTPRDGLCNYCWSCDRCPVPWPCPDSLAADRAEARLREVQGE